jgi:excisionase family DNA binding protein
MNADRAAAYCGLSRTKFAELVSNGILPAAKTLGGLARWDRVDLDAAWDVLGELHRPARTNSMCNMDDLIEVQHGQDVSTVH